jgi:hypothetical protein
MSKKENNTENNTENKTPTNKENDKIKLLEERIKALENQMGKTNKPKTKRKPSAFNTFMKDAILQVKQENPGIQHSEAFKLAANLWSEQKHNTQ